MLQAVSFIRIFMCTKFSSVRKICHAENVRADCACVVEKSRIKYSSILNIVDSFEDRKAVVVSNNFNNGALGATTPKVWVWPSSSHAHTLQVKI